MMGKAVRCIGAAIGMFAALTACGRQTAETTQPYEIVTKMRPESQEAYMRMYRQMYDACASVRAIQHLPPPPPLVALPADFVMARTTYLGSGGTYLIRKEESDVVMDATDCKSRIDSTVSETVVRGGQVYGQRRESNGQMEIEDPVPLAQPSADGSSFTEKRTVAGTAMRCGAAALRTDIAQEACAADAGAGVLLDGLRYPIVLYSRGVVPVRNMVVVTEPVSVQIGKSVNPDRIALSRAK